MQQYSGTEWHILTHNAHMVPIDVFEDWRTEGFMKGLGPHIAVLCCTALTGISRTNQHSSDREQRS